MVWLAVLGALTSAVGAYYYLRVLVYMFMREPAEGATIAVPMRSGYVVTAMVVAALFVLYFLRGPVESALLCSALVAAGRRCGPRPRSGRTSS